MLRSGVARARWRNYRIAGKMRVPWKSQCWFFLLEARGDPYLKTGVSLANGEKEKEESRNVGVRLQNGS